MSRKIRSLVDEFTVVDEHGEEFKVYEHQEFHIIRTSSGESSVPGLKELLMNYGGRHIHLTPTNDKCKFKTVGVFRGDFEVTRKTEGK